MKKFTTRRLILMPGLFLVAGVVARNETCKDPLNMANYVPELSEDFRSEKADSLD